MQIQHIDQQNAAWFETSEPCYIVIDNYDLESFLQKKKKCKYLLQRISGEEI